MQTGQEKLSPKIIDQTRSQSKYQDDPLGLSVNYDSFVLRKFVEFRLQNEKHNPIAPKLEEKTELLKHFWNIVSIWEFVRPVPYLGRHNFMIHSLPFAKTGTVT